MSNYIIILKQVLRRAVLGMLPKNLLRKMQAKKLRIFPFEKHLHEDMLPAGTESILVAREPK